MPIKGLSEQRRMPRLGKIHLGIKKKSSKGNEYPSATDYFVVPDDIKQYIGDKPTELQIMIPIEDDELWCPQYYKCYSRTRGLVCKGDGETCRRMIDTSTGDKANRDTQAVDWKVGLACTGRECPDYMSKDCREVMCLQFILPDVPGLGVYQIDTSSINSIRNINSDATMIRNVYKHIAMLPLILTIEPQEVVNPDDGKKKTVRTLHLRIKGTLRDLMIEAAKPITELLLPAPAEDEEPLDVQTEAPDPVQPEREVLPVDKDEAEAAKASDLFANDAQPKNNKARFVASCKKAGYKLPEEISMVTQWISKHGTELPFDSCSDEKQEELIRSMESEAL